MIYREPGFLAIVMIWLLAHPVYPSPPPHPVSSSFDETHRGAWRKGGGSQQPVLRHYLHPSLVPFELYSQVAEAQTVPLAQGI